MKRYKYNVYSEILNSEDYGIPYLLKRIYIVCIARDVKEKDNNKSTFVYRPPFMKKCRDVINFACSNSINLTSQTRLNKPCVLFLKKYKEKQKNMLSLI